MTSTPEPYFEHIWNDRIDARDISCLQKALKRDIFGYTPEYVLREVAEFRMQFWRGGAGDSHFIMLTHVTSHPAGKELMVWNLAGTGYAKLVPFALPILLEYARENDCRWLTGFEKRKGFERIYQMLKPNAMFRKWIMEI